MRKTRKSPNPKNNAFRIAANRLPVRERSDFKQRFFSFKPHYAKVLNNLELFRREQTEKIGAIVEPDAVLAQELRRSIDFITARRRAVLAVGINV